MKLLFIHSWMKVKAMAERCQWTGEACCVAEVTAAGVSQCSPHTPRGRSLCLDDDGLCSITLQVGSKSFMDRLFVLTSRLFLIK